MEEVRDEALLFGDRDTGPDEMVNLMYPWDIDAEAETVVEARVKVVASDDPLAVTVRLANGAAVEYLTLGVGWIGLHHAGIRHDLDTTSDFRTYRIVMQGRDIRVTVDDQLRLDGTGRLATPAGDPAHWLSLSDRLTEDREMWNRNSLLFGSASGPGRGEALWESISFKGTHRPTARLYDMVLALRFEKPPIKTGENILRNHDFGTGNGLPEQWITSRGAESVKVIKEGGKVGARCVLIEPTQVSALVQSNIPVEHGKAYRISGYFKTEDFSCTRGDLAIVPTDWPVSYGISLGALKGTADWKLLEEIVTIDRESRDGKFSLYFHIMGSKGRIWLDGVKVEEVVE